MRNDGAKRVFLGVLLACLAIIVYLCADGRTVVRWTAEVVNPRQNESLYLEQLEDGAFYVGGEGKLYGTDMHAMIEGQGRTPDAITDLIIGDGITEIGYDVIVEYPILHTIRLGRNVKVAGNGSIRECGELQFVFLPSGLERASRDFLYECNDCIVVTDGTAKQLPKLRNVKKANLITGVDSLAAMRSAWTAGTELPEMVERWWD